MEVDHLLGIHAIHVVGAEHDDVVGILVVDQIQRLIDRVGRAGVPARAEPLLGRHRRDVLAGKPGQPPVLRNVAIQRMRLVLGEHADTQVSRIHQIGQHEVDQPVGAAERNRRFGAVGRQWVEPLALPARQDDAKDVWQLPHDSKPICTFTPRLAIGAIDRFCRSRYLASSRSKRTGMRRLAHFVGYRRHHAGGDDDSGVSARGLRRGGGARHRACRAAAPSVRGRRALHGGAASGRVRARSPIRRSRAPTRRCRRCRRTSTWSTAASNATVVHSHTWYTGLAGHLAALLYGIPHVLTAHSLEPMRPWKAEQLGGGLPGVVVGGEDRGRGRRRGDRGQLRHARRRAAHLSRAGSQPGARGAQRDRHRRLVSGPQPQPGDSVLDELGVDLTRPIVAFVGRITRQKGVAHLVAAAHYFAPEIQLVLCAGAPDTPEIAAEVTSAVQELARARSGVFWVREMLPIGKIREILSAATVFVCPSVYEPLGIVNLEAMACATAVVASDVGGIPEVVADRQTGLLVHYDASDPAFFERRLAEAVNSLVADPDEGAPVRPGRAAALYPGIFLGAHRRADLGDLPKGVFIDSGAEPTR